MKINQLLSRSEYAKGPRDVRITSQDGSVVFEMKDVEAPAEWGDTAVTIAAQKYFRKGEKSVCDMCRRVSGQIARWGVADGYFDTYDDAVRFEKELFGITMGQVASWNSPVWFSVGVEAEPQTSACFLSDVEDSMESILEEVKTEGIIFKRGSGVGTNLSKLRGSGERLSGGGSASGPMPFAKGYDGMAGAIKSGGRTRRSACLRSLNADHPDVEAFIDCKAKEEAKGRVLLAAGFSGGIEGEAASSLAYQNANHSVRVTDKFMQQATTGGEWNLTARSDGHVMKTVKAGDILDRMAQAAWDCGDPGILFHDTINAWHTCPTDGEIVNQNPCCEITAMNNTSCNLSSLNLAKFLNVDGSFDTTMFQHVVRLMAISQDILMDHSSYPTEAIKQGTLRYRNIGIGYTNLGSLLMRKGLAYDSDEGRDLAASITALMTATAYHASSEIAADLGSFPAWGKNREAMEQVLNKHLASVRYDKSSDPIWRQAILEWAEFNFEGTFRNSFVTCLAPTGTISFLLGCATTGIEPELCLVKHKSLVGGGSIATTSDDVSSALGALGYPEEDIASIVKHVTAYGTVAGAGVRPEHLAVFDCALSVGGGRTITPMGHLKMMAAVQPLLSLSISKTINCPSDFTPADVRQVFISAWKMGLKSVTIYRDGSKGAQPVNAGRFDLEKFADDVKRPMKALGEAVAPILDKMVMEAVMAIPAGRRRLPDTRKAITHKGSIAGHEFYVNIGLYDDGTPGEVFVTMSKEGSTIGGLVGSWAIAMSMCLQYGVPLEALVDKFSHVRFEPAGITRDSGIRFADSVVDYVVRWMGERFLPIPEEGGPSPYGPLEDIGKSVAPELKAVYDKAMLKQLAPSLAFSGGVGSAVTARTPERYTGSICGTCGSQMVRAGTCYACPVCGGTSGCS